MKWCKKRHGFGYMPLCWNDFGIQKLARCFNTSHHSTPFLCSSGTVSAHHLNSECQSTRTFRNFSYFQALHIQPFAQLAYSMGFAFSQQTFFIFVYIRGKVLLAKAKNLLQEEAKEKTAASV